MKPLTKPIEVRNDNTLRMLVQLLEDLCNCQPEVLNDETIFLPMTVRIGSAIASATALNSVRFPLEEFSYEALFRLYCALINIKAVMDVSSRVHAKGSLATSRQLELLKAIGKLGVFLERAQP